ncbi:MAG: PAS domain-containing protein, partial [Phycisphaeraceae bacterium]
MTLISVIHVAGVGVALATLAILLVHRRAADARLPLPVIVILLGAVMLHHAVVAFEWSGHSESDDLADFVRVTLPLALLFVVYTLLQRGDERRSRQRDLAHQEVVARNERRYRLLFDANPAPVFVVDRESLRFLAVNKAAISIYGYSREEFLAMTILDIHPADDAGAVTRSLARSDSIIVNQGIWRHRRKDGTTFKVSIHADEMIWEGRPARLATAINVDDLIETQTRLQDTQYLFETAQKAANIGWWYHVIPEDRLVWSSQTFEIFGVTPAQFSGRSEDFYRRLHPDDLAGIRVAAQASIDRNEPYDVEYRVVRPDGKVRWVHCQASMLRDPSDAPQRMVGVCQDITQRKRYEQALWRVAEGVSTDSGESFLRSLVGQLAKALEVEFAFLGELSDTDGDSIRTLAVCNDGSVIDNFQYKLAGTPCANVLKSGLCIHPRGVADEFPADPMLREMAIQGYAGIPLARPDGSVIGLLVVLHRQPFDDSMPIGEILRVFANRATAELQRLRMEQALRESEHRLDLAMRTTELGVWDWNLHTGEMYFDARWCAMLGYSRDEIEPRVESWERLVHPDDAADVQAALKDHLAGRTDFYRTEHRVRTRNGKWKWILDQGQVVERNHLGKPLRATGTHRDIDDRKLAELATAEWKSRYEAAIHASGRLLYDWNSATNEVAWAGDALSSIGYEIEELGDLHHWESLIHPEDVLNFRREVERAARERSPFMLDYRLRHKDGHWVDVEDSGYLIDTPTSDTVRVIGFVTDVTRRNADERERLKLGSMLLQVQKLEAIGKLSASVAHDFNNLLTAIRGHLALVRRQLPPASLVEPSLAMIEKATQQGVDITHALLSFAHQTPTKMVKVDLAQVVAEAAVLFESLLPASVRIASDVKVTNPVWILGDRSQIHQVLLNLVINARDAMPDGGVIRIALAAGATREGAGQVAVLTISDQGVGMDEGVMRHMFEPFYTTKGRGKGTGLGLAIVHGIVTQHRGQVDVRSSPGEGTTFQIELPIVKDEPVNAVAAP